MKRLLKYFFAGIVIVLPIVITAYLIYTMISWVDSIFPVVVFPGFGILVVAFVITLVGVLANVYISQPIFAWIEKILLGLPIISLMYKAFKDILTSLVGQDQRLKMPVAVKMGETGNLKLGFITQDYVDVSFYSGEEGYVAVYFPHAYNFSGNLMLVPQSNITVLERNASSVMKFIVSGGIIDDIITAESR